MCYVTYIPILKTYLQIMMKVTTPSQVVHRRSVVYRQCNTYIPMMKKVTMPSQVVAEVIFDPGDWSHVYD